MDGPRKKVVSYCMIIMWQLFVIACSTGPYEKKAELIKEYVQSFYQHLETHQVEQAMIANQHIEEIALEAEANLLQRVGQMNSSERAREWKLIKTAKETAAENWLAVGWYFVQTGEYDRAQRTYEGLIERHHDPAFQPYVERAEMGIKSLGILLDSQ